MTKTSATPSKDKPQGKKHGCNKPTQCFLLSPHAQSVFMLAGAIQYYRHCATADDRQQQANEQASRDFVNPLCSDLYNAWQNQRQVALTDAATAAASSMEELRLKALWEDCENNGPLVGMPNDTTDGGDEMDTVPDATDPMTDMGME